MSRGGSDNSGCGLISIILTLIVLSIGIITGSKEATGALNAIGVFLLIIISIACIVYISKIIDRQKEKREKKNADILEGFKIIQEKYKRRQEETSDFFSEAFSKSKNQNNPPSETSNDKATKYNDKPLPPAFEATDDLPF